MSEKLKEIMERIEKLPARAQEQAADVLFEIEQSYVDDVYHATPEELVAIDKGLKAAQESRFASEEEVQKLFEKYRA